MLSESERKKIYSDMKRELPKVISKEKLKEWLLKKQKNNRNYCREVTTKELIYSAQKCNIQVMKGVGYIDKSKE